jgi:hypothetical protein
MTARERLRPRCLRSASKSGKSAHRQLARECSSIPIPFLVVLVFWLTALFAGFGLFASRNLVTAVALCVYALIVSSAIFLILDMDQPLKGLMKLSDEPLRSAIAVIGDQR